jgi:hypothetical protein
MKPTALKKYVGNIVIIPQGLWAVEYLASPLPGRFALVGELGKVGTR